MTIASAPSEFRVRPSSSICCVRSRGGARPASPSFCSSLLLAVNILLNPARFAPAAWGTVIGLAAPLIAASIAATPAILGGRGGIDVSVGPLMGFVNALIVQTFIADAGISSPWLVVPAALAVGALAGALNGFLAVVVRIQPIVATLGTYLLFHRPHPDNCARSDRAPCRRGSKVFPGSCRSCRSSRCGVVWLGLKQLPYYEQLMAVGSDDRACYTAGVPVGLVRFLSYCITRGVRRDSRARC